MARKCVRYPQRRSSASIAWVIYVGIDEIHAFAGTALLHALISHLSPTIFLVERKTKRSASVVQTVPSVYGLAPQDYLLLATVLTPISMSVLRYASNVRYIALIYLSINVTLCLSIYDAEQ